MTDGAQPRAVRLTRYFRPVPEGVARLQFKLQLNRRKPVPRQFLNFASLQNLDLCVRIRVA